MGMLMNIQEQPFTAKTEEIDLIGAPYIFQAKTGKKSWRFAVGGYVRDDEGSVLKLSNARRRPEPHSVIYARYGDMPGAHADIIPAVIASGGDFDLPRDGLIKVNNLQYQLAEGSGVRMDGTLLANRLAVATSASPYTDLRYDFGGPHLTEWTASHPRRQHRMGRRHGAERADLYQFRRERQQRMGARQRGRRAQLSRRRRRESRLRRNEQREPQPVDRLRFTWTGGTNQSADIIAALHRA